MVSKNMNKCKRHPFSRLIHYILRSKQKLLSAHASGRRLRGRTWTLRRPTPPRAARLGVCPAGPPSPPPPPVSSATFEPWSVLLPGCVCESGPTAIVEVATPCHPFGPSFVSRGQTRGQSDPKNVTSLRALVLHCMQATPSGSHEDSHRPAAGQGTVRRVPALLTASSGGAGAAGRAQHTPRASRRGWPR